MTKVVRLDKKTKSNFVLLKYDYVNRSIQKKLEAAEERRKVSAILSSLHLSMRWRELEKTGDGPELALGHHQPTDI